MSDREPAPSRDRASAATGAFWSRLRDAFERALAHRGAARDAFVARIGERDPALCRALDALLAADHDAADFMDRPLLRRADRLPNDERLGPYRVLRPIGRGGTSTVYLAVRDDDAFERRVVVKLVRADRQDADLERRLRTERRILASLDHPNIARLFDGGTTDDRRPFFAMEYVEGLPITAFADQHRLTVEERLVLFRKVLAAVHVAHQSLIVHRDLKPSNILVQADGEPKLLDFGIAKLLKPDLAGDEPHATATWLRLMTPHYASPEQARGKLVGTASDVYSLGVLLFELLTGRLPFDLAGQSAAEIEKILTEHDPPKPSAAIATERAEGGEPSADEVARARSLSVRELARRLAGDLDAIVLKALRSAPQRRYGGADRFADDLERFAHGLPVEARQGTWRYRLGKLVRRHRTAAAAAAALVVALAIGFGALAAQHAETRRQRDAAEGEREKRETVLTLLLDVLAVADPNVAQGASLTIHEALEASAPKLARRLADRPALHAELLAATGTIYHNLGLWARARVDLEQALSLRRALHGDGHPSVARTRSRLALVLANLGELDQARHLSGAATEAVRGESGAVAVDDVGLLNDRVTVLCAAREYAAASPLSAEALAVARRGADTGELATALINRAVVDLHHGAHAVAAELLRQGVDLLTLELGGDHPRLVSPLSNLGSARRRAGDLDGARAAFQHALDLQRATLGDGHPTLAITLNNLAGVHAARGEHAQAIATFRQAASTLERQSGADHPRLLYLEVQIARTRIEAGTPAAAAETLAAHLPRWRAALGGEHRFVVLAGLTLGRALLADGDLDRAEPLLTAGFDRALANGWRPDAEAALDDLRRLYQSRGTPERFEAFDARLADG